MGAKFLDVPMSSKQVPRSLAAVSTGQGRSNVGLGLGGTKTLSKAP